MHFRTLGLHYTFRCSSGLSDVAIGQPCDIAVQNSRTLLYIAMQCESEELAICFNAVRDSLTLLPSHCQSRLSNHAIHLNAVQAVKLCYAIQCSSGTVNFVIRYKAGEDYQTLPYVLTQVKSSVHCRTF